ncbi:MAG: lipopolysaccharide core heptose(I) kinase RfaP [Gammaproteobacteria bacterium]
MIHLSPEFQSKLPGDVSFESIMNLQGEVYRKVEGRKTIRCELGGVGYFVKSHSGVGWKEIFKNLLQGKRPVLGAKQELLAINKLKQLNIDTMNVAGFGQQGCNPAGLRSFIVTEELNDTVSLEDFCAEWPGNRPDFGLKLKLINKVADIARVMHGNGVNHRDFYICHFLLDKKALLAGAVKLYLIDLHRVQIRRRTPRRWVIKDIAGLYFSVMNIGLTQRDLLRFVKLYSGKPLSANLRENRFFWQKVSQKAMILRQLGDKHVS